MKLKKVLAIGAIVTGSYILGKSSGVIDCILSTEKELNANHKLSISKAVWRPLKNGVKITLSKLEDKT